MRDDSSQFFKYLPLNSEIRSSGLYVTAGGYTVIRPNSEYPPVIHPAEHHFEWSGGRILDEFQAIYITSGSGVFESRSCGQRAIMAGDLIVLFPGEWHRYSPEQETGWIEYWVAFNGIDAAELIAGALLSPENPIIRSPVDSELKQEFVRVCDEIRREQYGYQKVAASRISVLLAVAGVLAFRKKYESSEMMTVIEEAKALISNDLSARINYAELAASLGVGYSLFRKEFRRSSGLSPGQYHLELRMNHAINLLANSNLPIAQIGSLVGCEPPGYFSRIFKEKTGMTPIAYRARSRGH